MKAELTACWEIQELVCPDPVVKREIRLMRRLLDFMCLNYAKNRGALRCLVIEAWEECEWAKLCLCPFILFTSFYRSLLHLLLGVLPLAF